jgi:DNA repair exonuclease SbcCD nuclease subunit
VVDAVNHDGKKLDWRLTVEDSNRRRFKLEIWKKHDPLIEWKEGEYYEIRDGVGQVWTKESKQKKLHSSGEWSAERIDPPPDCSVMVMGDSHVGQKRHSGYPNPPVDCAQKFKQAVTVGINRGVDYVVHTGDVFYESVTEGECNTVNEAFQMMADAGTKFLYILGNHECDRGNRLLQRWDNNGVAIHLDQDGIPLTSDVRVRGHDYQPGSTLSVANMALPDVLINTDDILVLHQTLGPFHDEPDADLNEINAGTAGGFEYVFSGHIHDPERPDWDEGTFVYTGSVEDLSTKPDSGDPSVWFLDVNDGEISGPERHKL